MTWSLEAEMHRYFDNTGGGGIAYGGTSPSSGSTPSRGGGKSGGGKTPVKEPYSVEFPGGVKHYDEEGHLISIDRYGNCPPGIMSRHHPGATCTYTEGYDDYLHRPHKGGKAYNPWYPNFDWDYHP